MSKAVPDRWRHVVAPDEREMHMASARMRVFTRQEQAGVRSTVSPQIDVGEIWVSEDPAVVVWVIPSEGRTILADVDHQENDPRCLLPALSALAQGRGEPAVLDFSEYAGDDFARGLATAFGARRAATKMQIAVDSVPEAVGISLRPMSDSEFADYRASANHGYAEERLASGLAVDIEEALQVADAQMAELLPAGLNTAEHRLFTVRDADDERVGILWLHLDDQRAFIYDIEMDSAVRGRGYGTQTLRAAAAEVRAAGRDVLALNVFGSNDAARRLYEREGYLPTEILWSAVLPAEPSRTVEVERKYDVGNGTLLPDWSAIDAVDAVTDGELRLLDARYLDTDDAALARAGVAVRRRTGGPDEGWHIKGPREGDGRVEIGWPLGADDTLPAAVAENLARWTTEPLTPLARIENNRTAYLLIGESGTIAEFVDDRVRASDLRQGVQREWREWEIELGPAAPTDEAGREALFAALEAVVFAAGARPAASDSKLARALGF